MLWSVFKEDTASNADVTSLRMSYGAALKPVLKAVQRYKNDHWAVPRRPRGSHRRRRQRVRWGMGFRAVYIPSSKT
jgi:hypothetical protein